MKVNELEGDALDRLVAKAEGTLGFHRIDRCDGDAFYSSCINCGLCGINDAIAAWDFGDPPVLGCDKVLSYSRLWEYAGPIIERERIKLSPGVAEWIADWMTDGRVEIGYGPTVMVAAMRCYVASKFGE